MLQVVLDAGAEQEFGQVASALPIEPIFSVRSMSKLKARPLNAGSEAANVERDGEADADHVHHDREDRLRKRKRRALNARKWDHDPIHEDVHGQAVGDASEHGSLS